jgi:hypothetical protein
MIRKVVNFSVLLLFIAATETSVLGQNSDISTSTLKNQQVPLPIFKHCDIGNPSISGTVKKAENGFDITAGGADIWGTKDEFNFVYVERSGNFDLAAEIESLMAAHLYTKAGLMARENLTANCRHVYFQVFSDNSPRHNNNGGYEFQYRKENGGEMLAIYPKTSEGAPLFPVSYPNTWIRLKRVNNDFTGYISADGKNWTEYTTFYLGLPSKIFLGIAVTSHNPDHAASANFRNIEELTH